MNRQNKRAFSVIAIIFVVFQVLVFSIPFEKTAVFWTAYLFGDVAILAQIYVLKIAFDGAETLKSKFYGFPIIRIGTMYALAQVVASLIFMSASSVLPVQISVVVSILLLAAAAIGTISADGLREELTRQDTVLKANVSTMRGLQSQVNTLVGLCKEETLQKKIRDFAEELKYSDPVSGDSTEALELEMMALITDLQNAVLENAISDADVLLQKLKVVLVERNRICKLNK